MPKSYQANQRGCGQAGGLASQPGAQGSLRGVPGPGDALPTNEGYTDSQQQHYGGGA